LHDHCQLTIVGKHKIKDNIFFLKYFKFHISDNLEEVIGASPLIMPLAVVQGIATRGNYYKLYFYC